MNAIDQMGWAKIAFTYTLKRLRDDIIPKKHH